MLKTAPLGKFPPWFVTIHQGEYNWMPGDKVKAGIKDDEDQSDIPETAKESSVIVLDSDNDWMADICNSPTQQHVLYEVPDIRKRSADTREHSSFKKQKRVDLTDHDDLNEDPSPLPNVNIIEATPQKPSRNSEAEHAVMPLVPHPNLLQVACDECQSLTPAVSEATSVTNASEDDVAEQYNEVLARYQEMHKESEKK